MPKPTAVLLMYGHSPEDDVRRLVQEARLAATEDLLQRCSKIGWNRVIFCSNQPDILAANGVTIERVASQTHPFHFGRELQGLVERCQLQDHAILYLGSGLPLLTGETLAQVHTFLSEGQGVGITNNLHSCDFAGWSEGGAVLKVLPPDTDNDLAWQLRRVGLQMTELPRTLETIFDVDTPTDLALLNLRGNVGPRLAQILARVPFDPTRLAATMAVLRSFENMSLCYGRISHHAWAYFAQGAACQTRIISEERGMRANGRLARGEVRSLLGLVAAQTGFPALFAVLAQLANLLILDTRVLMAHEQRWPAVEDRYYSDLGQVDAIHDPWLREMTAAAMSCGVPALLGGHSLVSGGLYLLADAVGPKVYPWP